MDSNLIRALKYGLLTTLLATAPLACLSATDAPKPTAPATPPIPPLPPLPVLSASTTTNAAPISGTTNPASIKHTESGITITTDDDDDDTPSKDGKHHSTITIGGDHGNGSIMDNLKEILIPIVAILVCVGGAFAVPILVVYYICYFKYKRRQENLALAKEFLSRGQPIPPQLLDESQKELFAPNSTISSTAGTDLRRGFKLAFAGLGVALALYFFSPGSTMFCWGLIPMVMGIGLVVSGAVQTRMESSKPGTSPTPTPPPQPPL